MNDEGSTKCLRYTCTNVDTATGVAVVHAVPKHAEEIDIWLTCLDLGQEYRGEGLPSISHKVLLRLLRRRERMCLTGEQKAELLEAYNHRCAACGAKSSQLEWDHKESFSTSLWEQTIESFQCLCPSCHQGKSAVESRAFENDIIASHFEKGVFERYVESPRPPPLVWRIKDVPDLPDLWIADVRRCRQRALLYCAHPVPVLSPLDNIEVVDGDY